MYDERKKWTRDRERLYGFLLDRLDVVLREEMQTDQVEWTALHRDQSYGYDQLTDFLHKAVLAQEGTQRFETLFSVLGLVPRKGQTCDEYIRAYEGMGARVRAPEASGGFGDSIPTNVLLGALLQYRMQQAGEFTEFLR